MLRWPLGIALAGAGLAVLFRWAPRRRQPGWPWLAFGAGVSVAGWTLVTGALALFFNFSKTFGETYGSLAGLVALQLWTFFSALAILYGVAVAAQLEAVRAGVPEAQDLSKDEMTVAEPVSAELSAAVGSASADPAAARIPKQPLRGWSHVTLVGRGFRARSTGNYEEDNSSRRRSWMPTWLLVLIVVLLVLAVFGGFGYSRR